MLGIEIFIKTPDQTENSVYNYKTKKGKQNNIKCISNSFCFSFWNKWFYKKKFIQKITLQSFFPLYSEDNAIMIIIDYVAIFIIFVVIGYGILNLLTLKKKNIKKENN